MDGEEFLHNKKDFVFGLSMPDTFAEINLFISA